MAATWRTVRVFISSTFRDMQKERDHLVKTVFRVLRECRGPITAMRQVWIPRSECPVHQTAGNREKANMCGMSLSAVVAAILWFAIAATPDLNACTLWGAAGNEASGGTIISKNRDWAPDHSQVLKMRRSEKGHTYFGLYAENGTEPGIKAGVNEKGLTVITASTSSIPKNMRDNQPGKHGVLSTLLSGYANCDELLAKKDTIFPSTRATFVMISDRRKIVMVEVGLGGKYAIKTVENGFVVHTNHFLDKLLLEFNIKIGPSSTARLERIAHLMETSPKPYRTESFAAMSKDQHDGPDNSLWRTGKNGRTLSSWVVETPAQGAPKLRVVIANPGQKEETRTLVLDQRFWKETK